MASSGLQRVLRRRHLHVDLLPVGSPRRDWKSTLLSDGYVTLRHPDWKTTLGMADYVGTELNLYAS